jgi:hypothetical protein
MSAVSTIKNVPPNRVVSLLTPTVFAPLAGAIAAIVANNAPGLDVSADSLQAIFIAGATIAFGSSGIWMKGWQDQQKRDAEAALAGAAVSAADVAETDDLHELDDAEAIAEDLPADIEDAEGAGLGGEFDGEDLGGSEGDEPEFPFGDDDISDELLALTAADEE